MHAGGERYDYIPALNDGAAHARFMTDLIAQHCQGWTPAGQENLPTTARGTSA